jgi:hypothetical protein
MHNRINLLLCDVVLVKKGMVVLFILCCIEKPNFSVS